MGQYLSVDLRPVSCARGTLKQIASLYKSHLRSATISEGNARIVDPFLCLNIACSPGSYDANVEPAKDDVLFTNSELLLKIVEKWLVSIYGEVESNSSKSQAKNSCALKPHGIGLLLARQAPMGSPTMTNSPAGESTLPQPRSASKLAPHTHSSSTSSKVSATRSSAAAAPSWNSNDSSRTISHSLTDPSATKVTEDEAPPSLLAHHASSVPKSTAENRRESSSEDVPIEAKSGWKHSMYTEDEDDEADLEIYPQGLPKPPMDLENDGDERLRDINVSNPWAFAKLNAAMRPSVRNKQLHTPGRQIGDVSRSSDPSSDGLADQADQPLKGKQLPRVQTHRYSPEASYPTPSPFPFPQKARGRGRADDASDNGLLTPVPSNSERQKRGALDTWVQKSLGGYGDIDSSPNIIRGDQGPPDLPQTRDFVSARSLPQGGTPLSEIPDASQRPRRKPVHRPQQQDSIHKPYVPPVRDPNRVWFDIGETPRQRQRRNSPHINSHQDSAASPTLILRDEEIEDGESIIPASAEQSLRAIHPDLAITLDYEARKQKASDAHRKLLRDQAATAAAAANFTDKAHADATTPFRPQHTTSSPHRNRQDKAIAALHTNDAPSPAAPSLEAAAELAALEPTDPRAYLLRMQHRQGGQAPESSRLKSRRQKTAMLPLETVTAETYMGNLTLTLKNMSADTVEKDLNKLGACDYYINSGNVGSAFEKEDAREEQKRWEAKLTELVSRMYTDEEGGRAHVNVDFSKIGHVDAAG